MFAIPKGWTVLDDHIYVNDGISGASPIVEATRPGGGMRKTTEQGVIR